MRATDFDFHLPDFLIAKTPVTPRDHCRLMVMHRNNHIEHTTFCSLPEYLNSGDLILLNNTKVFPAKLTGKKETGGKFEILLIKETEPGTWEILSREKYSGIIYISDKLSGEISNGNAIRFREAGNSRPDIMKTIWKEGKMPLPPYIKRQPVEEDKEWYQTVYAEETGSIAAPTAGMHFTKRLMDDLINRGIKIEFITLHIGTGTFKPVRAEDISEHSMDAEYFEIKPDVIETIKNTKASGRKVITTGTTTTRAVEGYFSGIYEDCSGLTSPGQKSEDLGGPRPPSAKTLLSVRGKTGIFIYPGYNFRIVDSLITNFHVPRATPLMLTSALCGTQKLLAAYGLAVSMKYRFFSYGDAMLVL